MKYDKKEPETMDADPMRLLVSAILAFTVMLFINGFVGSMGGFPAFVAFTLVFFRIRTRAGMENGGMQQELSDRQITGRLLWKYAAGYLVLWGILRIAFLISRVTGWGNINGASAVEYVRQMWNTSLLEKWAYFFAGMIMFAFVLSLFPLAVIREKVRWIRYALVDGAVFALVCLGMNGVCRLKFEQKSSGRATCLIDHLLLCGRMRTWQEITCLLAMVVFILVIGAFVFSYASRQYAVKNIDGIPASAPIICITVSGEKMPDRTNGMLIMRIHKIAFAKYFFALSSSCAFNIVYRVADPTPIIDPMAKIRLYTGSTRFNTVIPSVPAACEIKNVSTII